MIYQEIILNKGSDLDVPISFTNSDGSPINLTGYTVEIFDAHEELNATISVINAVNGTARVTAEYSPQWPSGRVMSFIVRISLNERNTAWPRIFVVIQ